MLQDVTLAYENQDRTFNSPNSTVDS